VMDADLQHPPSLVPELVAVGERSGADLVVASRYTEGGDRAGLYGGYRRLASGLCTLLAKTAFRRRLRGVSDPMSGFFAVRAATLDPGALRPFGYKILLELIVRSQLTRITEVPFRFQPRFAGASKAGLAEGCRFLRHVLTLLLAAPRARMLAFGIIGLSGFAPNLAALWLLSGSLGIHYLLAEVLANQVAVAWNFLLLDLLVFRDRRYRHWAGRFGKFLVLANADLIARIPLLGLLVTRLHMNVLLATAITLTAASGVRFVITDRLIYLSRPDRGRAGRATKAGMP
jgi:dolichol-phosphate mannosyltransferase